MFLLDELDVQAFCASTSPAGMSMSPPIWNPIRRLLHLVIVCAGLHASLTKISWYAGPIARRQSSIMSCSIHYNRSSHIHRKRKAHALCSWLRQSFQWQRLHIQPPYSSMVHMQVFIGFLQHQAQTALRYELLLFPCQLNHHIDHRRR